MTRRLRGFACAGAAVLVMLACAAGAAARPGVEASRAPGATARRFPSKLPGATAPRVATKLRGATARPLTSELLSNETTFTRWAYLNDNEPIYEQPRTSSARVTRLKWSTESGLPESYLLLRAYWDAKGREWVEVRIPMRPNGRTGWVQRDALGEFHLTHLLLVIDRQQLRISLYSGGHLQWHAPVGVGKPSTPTPPGRFWITEVFKINDPSSGYYPYAFGTSDYSTLTDWPEGGVVGIHGPYYEPQLIPGRISHGCVRLGVADDNWLAHRIAVGTPVRII